LEWDTFDRPSRRWAKSNNDYWSNLEPDEIIDRALRWLKAVEKKTGRAPVVYTSREWWIQRIKDESKVERLGPYSLWLASYANKDLQLEKPNTNRKQAGKWNDWVLWQFTNMGDLSKAGIKNPDNPTTERWDVNIYPGTIDDFRKEMGLTATIGPV